MSGQQDKKQPVSELTTDEAMKRLFPPEVANAAKETALKARKKPKKP